jgi:Fe2+ transport system protein FeoA
MPAGEDGTIPAFQGGRMVSSLLTSLGFTRGALVIDCLSVAILK